MDVRLLTSHEAIQYYSDLGFDTFPLSPGQKSPPMVQDWNHKALDHVWGNAPPDSNIAIRCGGKSQLAVIDCDEKNKVGTVKNVQRYLEGLGLQYTSLPIVQTTSGNGRHIYMRLSGTIEGSSLSLASQIGAGEFRYGQGAYVVAPPSRIASGKAYTQISGDFANLPDISIKDVRGLLGNQPLLRNVNDQRKYPSRLAWKILKGDIPLRYPSRSEAEQALIVSLINSGYDFGEIQGYFMRYPCAGKFRELYSKNPRLGIRYFRISYDEALKFSQNVSPGRRLAQRAISWALNRSWLGRTGGYDRELYLAHAQIAFRSGKIIYAASSRTLAEFANMSHVAASNGTRRLIGQGLLQKEISSVATLANQYRLIEESFPEFEDHFPEVGIMPAHDVFSYQGLGKSCKQIWEALKNKSLSVAELVDITGRTPETIRSNLRKMTLIPDFETGELVSMVTEADGIWKQNSEIDLDYIGELLGVNGLMKQRKQQHEFQREVHQQQLQFRR